VWITGNVNIKWGKWKFNYLPKMGSKIFNSCMPHKNKIIAISAVVNVVSIESRHSLVVGVFPTMLFLPQL